MNSIHIDGNFKTVKCGECHFHNMSEDSAPILTKTYIPLVQSYEFYDDGKSQGVARIKELQQEIKNNAIAILSSPVTSELYQCQYCDSFYQNETECPYCGAPRR